MSKQHSVGHTESIVTIVTVPNEYLYDNHIHINDFTIKYIDYKYIYLSGNYYKIKRNNEIKDLRYGLALRRDDQFKTYNIEDPDIRYYTMEEIDKMHFDKYPMLEIKEFINTDTYVTVYDNIINNLANLGISKTDIIVKLKLDYHNHFINSNELFYLKFDNIVLTLKGDSTFIKDDVEIDFK
jgi:hypothetical protein